MSGSQYRENVKQIIQKVKSGLLGRTSFLFSICVGLQETPSLQYLGASLQMVLGKDLISLYPTLDIRVYSPSRVYTQVISDRS